MSDKQTHGWSVFSLMIDEKSGNVLSVLFMNAHDEQSNEPQLVEISKVDLMLDKTGLAALVSDVPRDMIELAQKAIASSGARAYGHS